MLMYFVVQVFYMFTFPKKDIGKTKQKYDARYIY